MTRRPEDQALPRLLGMTGIGAMSVVGVFWLAVGTLAVASGGPIIRTPVGGAALAAVLLAAIVLVLPGPYPLPWPRTAATIAAVVFSTAAIDLQLVPHGSYGYETWHFGADTFLMFGLALRGRVTLAWIGMGAMAAITIGWSMVADGGPWDGLGLVYRQLGTMIPGTLLAIGLRSTGRRIVAFREAEARRVRAEARRKAVDEQRERDLGAVRRLALPTLRRLADSPATDADRVEHRVLEGELRDRIRGRKLATGAVVEAVRAIRRRGIDIVLMDDLETDGPKVGEPPAAWLDLGRAWLATQLDGTHGDGPVTVRLARDDRGAVLTLATSASTRPAVFRMMSGPRPGDRVGAQTG